VTSTLRLTASDADLDRAAVLLRDGRLVAIPTETVYGLAVRADDADAVARLFVAKDRPADNPLIVHVADVGAVATVARVVTPLAQRLLARFSPGPLTLVLEARDDLPRAVTGGLGTVAVRVPDHPVALALLRRCGVPLAAPSANRSSRPSPTRVEHVLADLDGRIAAVVDGGPTRIGLESTVVDARGSAPVVLREGAIGREEVAAVRDPADRGGSPGDAPDQALAATDDVARSPGTRHRHYAPAIPVHLAEPGGGPAFAARVAAGGGQRGGRAGGGGAGPGPVGPGPVGLGPVGLVAVRPSGSLPVPAGVVLLAAPRDVAALAAELFAQLRLAEDLGLSAVVVEGVTEAGIGRAVMDRLRRAADATGGHAGA
jgi:L-threonylcarbamoyladenylate synthase